MSGNTVGFGGILFGWTTQKGSEELVAAVRKAMGAGQPKDEAESDKPGWIMRNFFPLFILDHDNPDKRAAVETLKNTMGPAGKKWGLGMLEPNLRYPFHPSAFMYPLDWMGFVPNPDVDTLLAPYAKKTQ